MTKFLDESVGFSCGQGNGTYVLFEGDNTGLGGVETVVVLLDRAKKDGLWTTATTVSLYAGWFLVREGRGPASLSMSLRNSISGDQISGTGTSRAINPGIQQECADTLVATLNVAMGSKVTITLSNAR